jgi:hypothetical protein
MPLSYQLTSVISHLTITGQIAYRHMTSHKITGFYTKHFRVCPRVTSEFRTMAIFKSTDKEKIIQIKPVRTSIIFQCTEICMSKCNGSWVLYKIKYIFKHSTTHHCVFLVFSKSGIAKSCLFTEGLSACEISWSHVDCCVFCIHLSSLKILSSPYSKGPLKKIIIQIKLVGIVPNFVWLSVTFMSCLHKTIC